MKKLTLFALLIFTASQAFAVKITGEEAKDEAPELTYLVPRMYPTLEKHTAVGSPYDVPGLRRLDTPEQLSLTESLMLLKRLNSLPAAPK